MVKTIERWFERIEISVAGVDVCIGSVDKICERLIAWLGRREYLKEATMGKRRKEPIVGLWIGHKRSGAE